MLHVCKLAKYDVLNNAYGNMHTQELQFTPTNDIRRPNNYMVILKVVLYLSSIQITTMTAKPNTFVATTKKVVKRQYYTQQQTGTTTKSGYSGGNIFTIVLTNINF